MEVAVGAWLIHAMSSPIVVTLQPSKPAGGISIAKLVLPHALGNAAATYVFSPVGRRDAENQHVLGQPALLVSHDRGDAQRETLFAEQRIAAVAGAE